MSKQPFQITAQKQGATAQIRIIGEIGWDINSEQFRTQIDDLVKQGATDAHVYINSPGGSCFDASEIVNILSVFKGNVTGEGGALVASAGTYIAAHCKTFIMPENGQFMVHKPSGRAYGNAAEIASYLKALQNIEADYYNTYKGIVKDITVFDAKWNAGDYWLTAREAQEQGFITGVKPKVKIDRETAAMIKACGSPIETEINQSKKENEMDLKTTALALGLPETATEEQVKARLQENQRAANELRDYKARQEQKEKTEKATKITALLNKAVAEKRIKADAMEDWRAMLDQNLETASKALEAIAPIEKAAIITGNGKTATYQGKTFEQLQEEDPEMLAELEKTDPEAFAELFAAWKKKNKIQ